MKKICFLFSLYILACSAEEKLFVDKIIEKSIDVYGWNQQEYAIDFDFRDYHYKLIRNDTFYSYQRTRSKEGNRIRDMINSNYRFIRFINDQPIQLRDSIVDIYSNSLNSVMYFFQIPLILKDPAVISELIGSAFIENRVFWVLKIKFKEEGGGKDFQDEFRYWIDKETYHIRYLAYNYLTDGGGTRFRKVTNMKEKKGFLFQDYLNFKPKAKFVSLDSLPSLYEKKELIKVSEIENRHIFVSQP